MSFFLIKDTLLPWGITVLVLEKSESIKCIGQPLAAIKWAGPVSFDIAPIAFWDNWKIILRGDLLNKFNTFFSKFKISSISTLSSLAPIIMGKIFFELKYVQIFA